MKDELISIIIPVYNERKSVANSIKEIKNTLEKSNFNYEMIVIDDCSTDGSYDILNKINGIKLVRHKINKGYSASIKTGIIIAKSNWILIIDADGTYPIKDIPKFFEFMKDYDMIIGARIGKMVRIPFSRRIAKWFLTHIASYIASTKIIDLNSGLRLFKKDLALQFWKLYPEKFSFTSTISMAFIANNYKIKYISIDYYKREGKSTIHPIKDFIEFNKILLKLCLFFRPLKIFTPLSIITFFLGLAILLMGLLKFNVFFDTTFLIFSFAAIQFFIFGLIAELIVRSKY